MCVSNLFKKSFTLIELLVVLAIIGVLVTLLLPSLKQSRESAKSAVCRSNLKQMGTLITMYESNSDGYFPAHGLTDPWRVTWDDELGRYDGRGLTWQQMKAGKLNGSDFDNNPGIYACPSDDLQRLFGSDPDNLTLSYAATNGEKNWGNGYLGITGWSTYRSERVSSYGDPVNTALLVESKLEGRMVGRSWGNVVHAQEYQNQLTNGPLHKGLKGTNMLRGDRSVSMVSFNESIDGGSMTDVSGTMWDVLKD